MTIILFLVLTALCNAQTALLFAQDATCLGPWPADAPDDRVHNTTWLTAWQHPEQILEWTAPPGQSFAVTLIADLPKGTQVEFCSEQVEAPVDGWQRLSLGIHNRSVPWRLQLCHTLPRLARVCALEAVSTDAGTTLAILRTRRRSDWMRTSRYGLAIRFTETADWRQELAAFDVVTFSHQASELGAGWVIWSLQTSQMAFPGPSPILDEILPGRTTEASFLRDLALALNEMRIPLLLHQSFLPADDLAWQEALAQHDATTVIAEFLAEQGERHGQRLAGWILGNGLHYSASQLEQFQQAARVGFSRRLLSIDSGIAPVLLPFQDFQFSFGHPGAAELTKAHQGLLPHTGKTAIRDMACLRIPKTVQRSGFLDFVRSPLRRKIPISFLFDLDAHGTFPPESRWLKLIYMPRRPCRTCGGSP